MTKMGIWLEGLNAETLKLVEEEKKKHAAAGIQTISFSGREGQEYVKKAEDTAWAALIKRSPEHGPKLRALLTK